MTWKWFARSAAMGFLYDVDAAYLVVFSVAAQFLALPLLVLSRGAAEEARKFGQG
jgi:hypothetical protein